MKKTFLIFTIICLFTVNLFSQTELLSEEVNSETFKQDNYGKNNKSYTHWYLGFDFFVPTDATKEFKSEYGKSHNFNIGYRYKFKITNWLAFGADLDYIFAKHYLNYPLFLDSVDNLADKTYGNQKLKINYIGGDIYMRLNFGRRGNSIGKFVDIAAFGLYNFDAKHIIINKLDNINSFRAKNVKTINSNLNYLEVINYGARLRLGYDRYVVTVSYSLSDIFTTEFKNDVNDWEKPRLDLPKLSVGFQLGLH